MDDTTVPVSMAQALEAFFADAAMSDHPATRARIIAVRRHLDVFLDTEAERALVPDERILVEAEREIDPVAAVARVAPPEALIAALPGFLEDAWLLPAQADARVQVRVVAQLAEWVTHHGLAPGMECFVHQIHTAVRDARRSIADRALPGAPPG
ncbi:hypothetical protein [Georgenia faecalis]|uniref:DUF885 family protein n=1 Tax=Georgenia faecalis TaxID=2483799 RepID=A0ABV9DAA7_9MICO|nr:hypothetical protein [Georgenia faecalis]